MFVLNYLQIDVAQIRKAAQIAKSNGNARFSEIADSLIACVNAIDSIFNDAERNLSQVIGTKRAIFVRSCQTWRYNRETNTVRIGPQKSVAIKPSQTTPSQRKRYWALWTLSHRYSIASDLLRPVRNCAKDAPLAPNTYYSVLKKTNKIKFMHTFEKMMYNAYHISKLAARA